MTCLYIQSEAMLQLISSMSEQPSSDVYPTALPSYHQESNGRLSTELNANDHLSHAKHHKRTETSDTIDKHFFPQSQPYFC